ncbi:hypothetical protein BU23DRAFT_115540 [Bimuria novae-zelandiae CBS 107.79]|uniref:Uncharacterized protein n=1 Tax=Bimuria novae-zelandiae CBS 107.79 TaxID=1447943 RepID=A0A6A5VAA9_9PLEO|nr:hypothetical protein BU23DRAFT_115540 [Bimuria novae-zelandiae CBS 107.79]
MQEWQIHFGHQVMVLGSHRVSSADGQGQVGLAWDRIKVLSRARGPTCLIPRTQYLEQRVRQEVCRSWWRASGLGSLIGCQKATWESHCRGLTSGEHCHPLPLNDLEQSSTPPALNCTVEVALKVLAWSTVRVQRNIVLQAQLTHVPDDEHRNGRCERQLPNTNRLTHPGQRSLDPTGLCLS